MDNLKTPTAAGTVKCVLYKREIFVISELFVHLGPPQTRDDYLLLTAQNPLSKRDLAVDIYMYLLTAFPVCGNTFEHAYSFFSMRSER